MKNFDIADPGGNDASDISTVILSDYSVFKKQSEELMRSFHDKKTYYGSIQAIPANVLVDLKLSFINLLSHFEGLKTDLQQEVNKNTKFLEDLDQKGASKTAIHELAVHKLEKSRQKLEFYGLVQEYSANFKHQVKEIIS
jgi:hypothetical protein